jgi:hypothetical protein
MLMSLGAEAEWTPVVEGTDGEVYFSEFAPLKKTKEGYWKGWQMWNFPKGETDPSTKKTYKSLKMLVLTDCEEDRRAVLSQVLYTGEMGTGEPFGERDFAQPMWSHLVPDTVGYLLAKVGTCPPRRR